MRVLFEGQILVNDCGYLHPIVKDDDVIDVEISDERVTTVAILHFTIDYPFEKPFRGQVITDAGASLRQIVAAVRNAFRSMYRGTVSRPVPHSPLNTRVEGDYGVAYHSIDDLRIEAITLDEETGELDISIGS